MLMMHDVWITSSVSGCFFFDGKIGHIESFLRWGSRKCSRAIRNRIYRQDD